MASSTEWWTLGLRVGLAATFALAAIGKAQAFDAFVDYLGRAVGLRSIPTPVLRRLAIGVILVEIALALVVSLGVGGAAPGVSIVGVMYVFTGFLATQYLGFAATDCRCWGKIRASSLSAQQTDERVDRQSNMRTVQDVMRPVLQTGRNAVICVAGVFISQDARGEQVLSFVAITPVLLLIAVALVVSTLRQRRQLSRRPHPRYYALSPMLAPLIVFDYDSGRYRSLG